MIQIPTHFTESLELTLAFDPRDWSVDRRDAWIYGIVCGWGHAIAEVANLHRWSAETVRRLQMLHEQFEAVAKASIAGMKAEREGE